MRKNEHMQNDNSYDTIPESYTNKMKDSNYGKSTANHNTLYPIQANTDKRGKYGSSNNNNNKTSTVSTTKSS